MGKRVGRKAFVEALEKFHGDTNEIAKALGLSYSNARYRIRQLENAKGMIPQKLMDEVAINSDDKKAGESVVAGILECKVDVNEYIPMPDPDYVERHNPDWFLEELGIKGKEAVYLTGEAGCGKSYSGVQLASRHKLPFLSVNCDDTMVFKSLLGTKEIINAGGVPVTFFRQGLLLHFFQIPSVISIEEPNGTGGSNKNLFLHEVLANRRIFIKDADGGKVVRIHPDCMIMFTGNPASSKYIGTSKASAAFADRVAVVQVDNFNPEQISKFFDTGDERLTASLKSYYLEIQRMVREQEELKVVFSLRGVQRIVKFLKQGLKVREALEIGFYNSALLCATPKQRGALEHQAKITFGVENWSEEVAQEMKADEVKK